MVISLLFDQVLKMTPKPIDWSLAAIATANSACALYDHQI